MSSAQDKPAGFKVTDRRTFTEEGQARAEVPATAGATAPEPVSTAPSAGVVVPGQKLPAAAAIPPIDFATFVLSLGSSVLVHLGHADESDDAAAASANRPTDLPMAKHTIDILTMLQEKTAGNLAKPEEELMQGMLYDLRLRYVEATKKAR